jgi:hypothetical protein
MTGKVKIRMSSSPSSGTIATNFVLRVAALDAQAGFKHDIQRRKGSKPFMSFASTSNQTVPWTPTSSGTWQFRARYRKTSSGAATGWSQPLTIVVN